MINIVRCLTHMGDTILRANYGHQRFYLPKEGGMEGKMEGGMEGWQAGSLVTLTC